MKARLTLLLLVFLLSTGATIRDLGTLPGGGLSSATAINEAGVAVGFAIDAAGVQRAVLFDGSGGVIEIPTPVVPGSVTEALDINDGGTVVGRMGTPLVPSRAFVWSSGGPVQDIGTGSAGSIAFAINNAKDVAGQAIDGEHRAVKWPSGWSTIQELGGFGGTLDYADAIADVPRIAGTSRHPGGPRHAALWDDTTAVDLGTLGGAESFGRAMVVRAWPDPSFTETFVVGEADFSSSPDDIHAFLWNAWSMTDLGSLPGWHGSRAFGINNNLDVVGEAWEAPIGEFRAVIWRGGVIEDLNTWVPHSGWTLLVANDINDAGQIVGHGMFQGEMRAFLLEP